MNDSDSFREPRHDDGDTDRLQREAVAAQYRRFIEKVVEKYPDLKGLGKGNR
jgi:hypothetical protein